MFTVATEAELADTAEYHFFPTKAAGTAEKSSSGVILDYSRGNDVGDVTVQDSSGKEHTYYLAHIVFYNGTRIDCVGSLGDGGGECHFPDPNFTLGKTLVTVSYFPAKLSGTSVSVVDNITSGPSPSPSP
jgi:hypothetical protein